MPRRDGTGPGGQGIGGGRGRQSRLGVGGSGNSGRANANQVGFCECPNCGTKVPHQAGQPCSDVKCQQCGSAMIRS
jgi:uncharacterized protein